ncbi:MAG TPA: response regulator [Kofleriaceae bacterium]|nr:response regulator [Kofleriaceae bacterium]
MTIDSSGSHRTVHSGVHAALVGAQVLVIDADDRVHAGIQQLLSEVSLHVTSISDADRALELANKQFFSVALVDIDTPSPRAGIQTIQAIKKASPTTMIIAMTPRRSYDDAVDAVRAGAVDLILKAPESVAYLKERVLDAVGRSVGKREVDTVLDEIRAVHDEFLQRFMEAERRAMDLADKAAGRDESRMINLDELRVLVVDEVDDFFNAIEATKAKGFRFVHATSGGEALDRISTGEFQYAMIAEDISDLPAKTIARTLRNQHPDTVVLTFLGPSENGHLELVEQVGSKALLKPFKEAKQLIGRLDELSAAWRIKAKERRYMQAFREKHFDFLRRYVELKTKIERAQREGPG